MSPEPSLALETPPIGMFSVSTLIIVKLASANAEIQAAHQNLRDIDGDQTRETRCSVKKRSSAELIARTTDCDKWRAGGIERLPWVRRSKSQRRSWGMEDSALLGKGNARVNATWVKAIGCPKRDLRCASHLARVAMT